MGKAASFLLVSGTRVLVLSRVGWATLMHLMGFTTGVPAWLGSVNGAAVMHLRVLLYCRLSILDLVVAMAPYADEQSLDSLYRTIQPSLQVSRSPALTGTGVAVGHLLLAASLDQHSGGLSSCYRGQVSAGWHGVLRGSLQTPR